MTARGTYALLLRLNAPRVIEVGALGALDFPSGWYLYLGSACGPGGLAARLARHRRRLDKRFHWHVDYLRAFATLVEVWTNSDGVRQECEWADAAAALSGAEMIAPGLGASDCQCPSHLFYYPRRPDLGEFKSLVQAGVERGFIDDSVGDCLGSITE